MVEFNIEEIEKTWTNYKKGKVFEGVVIKKEDNGVIFNIGGKNDAFIEKSEIEEFEALKIGERFSAIVLGNKNEKGQILASQIKAKDFLEGVQKVEKLKLGSKFSFVCNEIKNGLCANLGEYELFVPAFEISKRYISDLESLKGQRFDAIVTEFDKEKKKIVASVKMLVEQETKQKQDNFWQSVFINKIVEGKVKNIIKHGIFVEIDGIDCFCHISNLSYKKVEKAEEVVTIGQTYQFRVLEILRDEKKVAVGLKQMQKDPKSAMLDDKFEGDIFDAVVIKILAFGALVKIKDEVVGLLHISNIKNRKSENVAEVLNEGDEISVKVISVDRFNNKISFSMD